MFILKQSAKLVNTIIHTNAFFRSAQKATKDLYEILGVTKESDPKQIKQAYYKLAQQYHPDKNSGSEAKQKFTEINNAYETLSDPQKKQMYDQTGHTGEGNAAQYNNFNQQDIFNQFKGGFQGGQGGQSMGGFEDILKNMFGGGGGFSSQREEFQNEPSYMSISISFEESVFGCSKLVDYEKICQCVTCKGSKCKPGTQPENCRTCNGTGSQTIRQGMFVMNSTCTTCMGEGKKIKNPCTSCSGRGVQKKRVKQEITIPRGISDGVAVKYPKKGNYDGDLLVKVNVKKSPIFAREGNNVISEIQISVVDAILGNKKEISTIQGKKKTIQIPKGIQPGEKITLRSEGFYFMNSNNNRGDHIVAVKIVIPRQISSEEKVIYEKLRSMGK